jgi:hypothetical protein
MPTDASRERRQLFWATARNNISKNRNVARLNPKVFSNRANPTNEPKVLNRGTQGISSPDECPFVFFEICVPIKMIKESNPRAIPAIRDIKPGPGFAKRPTPKLMLCQQTYKENKAKNREEKKSLLITEPPVHVSCSVRVHNNLFTDAGFFGDSLEFLEITFHLYCQVLRVLIVAIKS